MLDPLVRPRVLGPQLEELWGEVQQEGRWYILGT
jgi:hypothetical protein